MTTTPAPPVPPWPAPARSSPATRSRTSPRWARRGAGTPARRGGTGQLQLPGAAVVELPGAAVALVPQPREDEELLHGRAGAVGPVAGTDLRRHRDVVPHRQRREQAQVLERAHEPRRASRCDGSSVTKLIVERDLARSRLDQPRDDVEQRGLAGPVRSDEAEDRVARVPPPSSRSAVKPPNLTVMSSARREAGDGAGAGTGGQGARSRRRRQRSNHQRSSSQSSSSPDGRRIMKPSIAPPRKISDSPSRSSQSSPGTFTSGPAR